MDEVGSHSCWKSWSACCWTLSGHDAATHLPIMLISVEFLQMHVTSALRVASRRIESPRHASHAIPCHTKKKNNRQRSSSSTATAEEKGKTHKLVQPDPLEAACAMHGSAQGGMVGVWALAMPASAAKPTTNAGTKVELRNMFVYEQGSEL